ncbi:GIY-YIG nuclease family protein [Candidatus Leptofilum sp.]|uniref:GIY-YIG nuclease family protein n=1 Tax=Candidatus Leptofilum sp. TaxID=3241576 RepID=UPI003B593554
MIRFTVKQLLAKEAAETLGHLIYVVRDADLVFYVGQSRRDVLTRFGEHMQKPSRLGQLIQLNEPASDNWSVDFYALADCAAFVRQKSLFALQEWQHFDMDMAEQAMIQAMRPVLNRDFNEKPTPLPAGYLGHAALFLPKPTTATSAMLSTAVSPTTSPQDRIWLNRMSLQGWVHETAGNRTFWRHASGKTLTEAEMAAYRLAGKLPKI